MLLFRLTNLRPSRASHGLNLVISVNRACLSEEQSVAHLATISTEVELQERSEELERLEPVAAISVLGKAKTQAVAVVAGVVCVSIRVTKELRNVGPRTAANHANAAITFACL